MTPEPTDQEREDTREALWLNRDLRGDHDSPWSYGPWDLTPSYAERASEDA